jgi:hypothetical protein
MLICSATQPIDSGNWMLQFSVPARTQTSPDANRSARQPHRRGRQSGSDRYEAARLLGLEPALQLFDGIERIADIPRVFCSALFQLAS